MGQVMAIFAASAKTTLAMWPIVERIIDAEDAKAEAKAKAKAEAEAEINKRIDLAEGKQRRQAAFDAWRRDIFRIINSD